MKFISAILVAFLCAAVSADSDSFPEFLLGVPLSEIKGTVDKFSSNLQCFRKLGDGLFKDEAVRKIWEESKEQADELIIDTDKCLEIKDPKEHMKCKAALIEDGVEVIFGFLTKFVSTAKWDLVKETNRKFTWKCFNIMSILRFVNELRRNDILEKMANIGVGYTNILKDVSVKNDLGDFWEKTEVNLKPHLDKWVKCSDQSNQFWIAFCHFKEGSLSSLYFSDYTLKVGEYNPKIVVQFIEEIRKKWFKIPRNASSFRCN